MWSLLSACHCQGVSYGAMQLSSSFGILEEVFFGDFGTPKSFQNNFMKEEKFRFTLNSRNFFSLTSYLIQLQKHQ